MIDRREKERAILRALVKKQHAEIQRLQARVVTLEDYIVNCEPLYMEDL